MNLRRILMLSSVLTALVVVGTIHPAAAGRGTHPTGTTKLCDTKVVGKHKRKSCKRVAIFAGHNADRSTLRTEPLERPSGDIDVVSENLSESVTVNIYRPDGKLDEAALAKLDEVFRCKRTNEVRAVDPRLYEMLSRVYDHFGRKRVELVSGFRFSERDSSRHHHASAMDIRIPGISINDLYAYAESLDQGGMGVGLYPTSQFIHFDYRAPGEPSYRWTDRSGPGSGSGKSTRDKPKTKAKTGRTKPAHKPTS